MRISVIIPCYNSAATLPATLGSVFAQTHTDLEIIVINDGSTDATLDVLLDAAKKDRRIVLIDQKNAGVAEARNAGLKIASGDYIAFLDADDLWHPTKIEKQAKRLAQSPVGVGAVYCWSRMIDEQDMILYSIPVSRSEGTILAQQVFDNPTGNGSTIMVRREAALSVGGFDDSLRVAGAFGADDHLFQLKLAERYGFVLVPEYLVGYRKLSTSASVDKERIFRSVMMCLDILHADNKQVPPPPYRWSRAGFLFDLVGYNLRLRRPMEALRCFVSAFVLDPERFTDRLIGLVGTKLSKAKQTMPNSRHLNFYDIATTADIQEHAKLHGRRMAQLAAIDARITLRA